LIPIHSLFFPDHKSFLRLNPHNFTKSIKSNLIKLKGKFDNTKELKELSQEKLEPYFIILDFEMNARIKTFPRHNVRASAESLFNYLKDKYNIKVDDKIPTKIEEIEKQLIKLMRKIDEINYK